MCIALRLDHLDFNSSGNIHHVGQPIYDAARGKVYFVYDAYLGTGTQQGIFFREYDTATHALAAAVAIDNTPTDIFNNANVHFTFPMMVRRTDGRLVCAYRFDNANGNVRIYARESADNGVTWSARALVQTDDLANSYDPPATISDGTNIWIAAGYTTLSTSQVFLIKRTGVGTWGAKSQIYLASGGNPDGGFSAAWQFQGVNGNMFHACGAMQSSTKGCFVGIKNRAPGGVFGDLAALYTNDGAAFTKVTIMDAQALGQTTFSNVEIHVGSDNRVRVSCNGNDNKLYVSYSDDFGQTWATPFTPTGDPAAQNWSRGPAMGLDLANRMFVNTVGADSYSRLYRGADSASGWAHVEDCLVAVPASFVSYAGDNVGGGFAGPDFIYTTGATQSGPSAHVVDLIIHIGVGASISCSITPGSQVVPYGAAPTTFCGPDPGAGDVYNYAWTGPSGFTASTKCITVSADGTYNLTVSSPITGLTSSCNVTLTVSPPPCIVNPVSVTVATGGTAQLCGPVGTGFTYAWTAPDGSSAGTTRCITVSLAGTYTLTVTSSGVSTSCQGILVVVPPAPAAVESSAPFRRGEIRSAPSSHPQGAPTVPSMRGR